MQAAAEREHGPCHPTLAGPSVRTFLRLQQRTRRNIICGQAPSRPLLHPEAHTGCMSPNFARYAVLTPGNGNKLHVRDAFTGELLHEWTLPWVPAPPRPGATRHWDAANRRITLLFGDAWTALWGNAAHQGERAGMVHLSISTGSTTITHVPLKGQVEAHFCPGSSLLAVQHGRDEEESGVISIFDSRGTLCSSTYKRG